MVLADQAVEAVVISWLPDFSLHPAVGAVVISWFQSGLDPPTVEAVVTFWFQFCFAPPTVEAVVRMILQVQTVLFPSPVPCFYLVDSLAMFQQEVVPSCEGRTLSV